MPESARFRNASPLCLLIILSMPWVTTGHCRIMTSDILSNQNRALSPDGKWIVEGLGTRPVCWSTTDGNPVELPCSGKPAAWAPDSHAFAAFWVRGEGAKPVSRYPEAAKWPGAKCVISFCTPKGEVTSQVPLGDDQGWAGWSIERLIGWTGDNSEVLLVTVRPLLLYEGAQEPQPPLSDSQTYQMERLGRQRAAVTADEGAFRDSDHERRGIALYYQWRLIALSAETGRTRLVVGGTMTTGLGEPEATLFSPSGNRLAIVYVGASANRGQLGAFANNGQWVLHRVLLLVDLEEPAKTRVLDYPGEMVGVCWLPDESGLLIRAYDVHGRPGWGHQGRILRYTLDGVCSANNPGGDAPFRSTLVPMRLGTDAPWLVAEDSAWHSRGRGLPMVFPYPLGGTVSPNGKWRLSRWVPTADVIATRGALVGAGPPRFIVQALPQGASLEWPRVPSTFTGLQSIEWSADSRFAVYPRYGVPSRADPGAMMASALVWVIGPNLHCEEHSVYKEYQKQGGLLFRAKQVTGE